MRRVQRLLNTFVFSFAIATSPCVAGSSPPHPRIVSTSPEVTELLFQLGKGGDIVATSAFSDYPEAAKQIPLLGPLYTPSIERTVALAPDWVLVDDSNLSPAYERALLTTHVRSMKIAIGGLADLFAESARILRDIYGNTESKFLARMKACADALPRRRPAEKFLAFVWLSPPTLVGHTTFLSDLIERAGGVNAVPPGWRQPYPQVSEEWLIRHPVDSIYFLAETPDAPEQAKRMSSRWWPSTNVRLVALKPESFARASFTPLRYWNELVGERGCEP